jgi:hypothetical protein
METHQNKSHSFSQTPSRSKQWFYSPKLKKKRRFATVEELFNKREIILAWLTNKSRYKGLTWLRAKA